MIAKNFQRDRNKYKTNGVIDIYNPEGNSYEKENQEKLNRFDKFKAVFLLYASFWRWYPDIFLDTVKAKGSKFNLFFFQRMFLRISMRNKYVFCTFDVEAI